MPGVCPHRRAPLRPRRAQHAPSAAACRSRLFQEVREKRGLAYSVYTYTSQYADTGLFGVYAGCLPQQGRRGARDLPRPSSQQVAGTGITDEELERGKGQLRGSLVLGLEDTGSRMSRIGKSELVYGELLSVDEMLRRIDAVTPDDVPRVAADVLDGARRRSPWSARSRTSATSPHAV